MKDLLLTRLKPYQQEQLLRFWDELSEESQAKLAGQIRDVDFALIAREYAGREKSDGIAELAAQAQEPRSFKLGSDDNDITPEAARARGEKAIAAGEVATLLVAGGQGTRLGFDHPKGMYPIGPVSDATLFQIHVEKVLALGKRYGVRIPFCLMTSPATHEETIAFFEENNRFGLEEDDLLIFCQGTMPAVDMADGSLLLAAPDSLALSPDGHGGTLAALVKSGTMQKLADRGIKYLFYFQVDNPLIDIGSSEFLGYHILTASELSSEVIRKQDPKDKGGNVVEVDGRLHVIEYSDLPDDVAERRKPDGTLEIWAGSIAIHCMNVEFLQRMADRADALPFHIAKKKVAFVDDAGEVVNPTEPNAIKFERFIFDLLPSAENAIVVEVDPVEHFAPLKNASGAPGDTPESVRAQIAALHRRWLREAGVQVDDSVPVEISPMFALDAEEVAAKVDAGTEITFPTYFT